MAKIRQYLQKREYIPFYFFAVIQMIYHIVMREATSSDAMSFFREQLKTQTLMEYIVDRYHSWSSRVIIEGLLCYISQNMILWKVLDWCMWMLLVFSLGYLFQWKKNREKNWWIIVGLLLIYPLKDLNTAGWMATTMNYLWPLALGMFCMTGIARIYWKKKTGIGFLILYIAAALYASNMEQMCAIMLGVYTLGIIYFCIKKYKFTEWWTMLVIWAISAAEIIFIMTCPGNAARSLAETKNWQQNYIMFNAVDKLEMGFVDTMKHIVSSENIMFLLFAIVLAILVFFKSHGFVKQFVSLIPVVWSGTLIFFPDAFAKNSGDFLTVLSNNTIINGYNYLLFYSYLPMLLYCLILLSVILCMAWVSTSWMELIGYILIFGLGLASRVVLGFSPTLYVSEERTFLYFYMVILVILVAILQKNQECMEDHPKVERVVHLGGAGLLMLALFNGLMAASAV